MLYNKTTKNINFAHKNIIIVKMNDMKFEIQLDFDDEYSRHILQLCCLHLNKITDEDKRKIVQCWNDILNIKHLEISNDY